MTHRVSGVPATDYQAFVDAPEVRRRGLVAPVEAALRKRIEEFNPTLNAYISVAPAGGGGPEMWRHGDVEAPIAGLLLAVKDNIAVAGLPMTGGSRFLDGHVPNADATVIRRLRPYGKVLGKTMLHEFAYGPSTINPHFGVCRNPWALDRIPGGSSGGSAVAVASDLCVGALGTDTGGSVRVPAALTGITGLRPTLGTMPMEGILPTCPTFDTVGPMARSVHDVLLMWLAMRHSSDGHPSLESPVTERPAQFSYPLGHVRVAVPTPDFFDDCQHDVRKGVWDGIRALSELGAAVEEIPLEGVTHVLESATTLTRREAYVVHAEQLQLHAELYGEDVRRRLLLGSQVDDVAVAKAQVVLEEWRRQLRTVFESFDVLVLPTTPATAPTIEGTETVRTINELGRNTYPWSAAGVPAISVPCGIDKNDLPIGMQIVSEWHDESSLFEVAATYQEVTRWHLTRPTLTAS